jgi:hypothetical protein
LMAVALENDGGVCVMHGEAPMSVKELPPASLNEGWQTTWG